MCTWLHDSRNGLSTFNVVVFLWCRGLEPPWVQYTESCGGPFGFRGQLYFRFVRRSAAQSSACVPCVQVLHPLLRQQVQIAGAKGAQTQSWVLGGRLGGWSRGGQVLAAAFRLCRVVAAVAGRLLYFEEAAAIAGASVAGPFACGSACFNTLTCCTTLSLFAD